jgi:hypothetical protein
MGRFELADGIDRKQALKVGTETGVLHLCFQRLRRRVSKRCQTKD